MEYVPAASALGLKVATAAPALSVAEVAVPLTVVLELLMKTAVPSLTGAAVEVLVTVVFKVTVVAPCVAEAELAEVAVLARMMGSVAGFSPVPYTTSSDLLKSVLWAKLA